jgi:hypothetical protein
MCRKYRSIIGKPLRKTRHTRDVAHPGDKIHIPLKEDDVLRAFLKVKPTKDMPRPGAAKKAGKGRETKKHA